jgi:hypothetical protein
MVLVHKKTATIPKTIFVDPRKLSLKKKKENLHVLKSWIFSPEGLSLLLVLKILYGGLIKKYRNVAFFKLLQTLSLICIWMDGFRKTRYKSEFNESGFEKKHD